MKAAVYHRNHKKSWQQDVCKESREAASKLEQKHNSGAGEQDGKDLYFHTAQHHAK